MDGPFEQTRIGGYINLLVCSPSFFEGISRALLCTLATDLAEMLHSKVYGFIWLQRKACKNLA